MSIQHRRLHQAHQGSGTLAGAHAAGEQPAGSSKCNWPDLILDAVVVQRQTPIVQVTRQRIPPSKAVLDGAGDARRRLPWCPLQIRWWTPSSTARPAISRWTCRTPTKRVDRKQEHPSSGNVRPHVQVHSKAVRRVKVRLSWGFHRINLRNSHRSGSGLDVKPST